MDAEQLQQLATNVELNHWPPHLGVTTDAEKVEYLAARLLEAVPIIEDQESQMFAFEETEAGREYRIELAVKAPSAVTETEEEMRLREQSKQRYFAVNQDSTYPSYDAGWKAAKAYYETHQ